MSHFRLQGTSNPRLLRSHPSNFTRLLFSGPSRAEIPLEVIEHIIDALRMDSPALRQFALTCHALLPRARYHLFYAIRFHPIQSEVNSLCDFLDVTPLVSGVIRVATVYPPHRFGTAVSSAEVFPAQLLKRLPRISHWNLFTGATRFPKTPLSFHTATFSLLRSTASIQTLNIKDLIFASNAELARLLRSLPTLEVLQCSNVKSQNLAKVVGPAHRQPFISLRGLWVRTLSGIVFRVIENTHSQFNS